MFPFLPMMQLGMQTALMMAEANMVIGMRMMGMAGMVPARPDENARMVSEKMAAGVAAAQAAGMAMMTGKRPDEIASAALKPIRRKTRSNARRLLKG